MEKFLRMPNLTVKDISETGSMYENSKEQAQEITSETKFEINALSNTSKMLQPRNQPTKPPRRGIELTWYNCGYSFMSNHKQQCSAKNKTCNFCGIVGHFQSVCRKQKAKKVATLAESDRDSDENVSDKNVVDLSSKENPVLFYTSVFSFTNPKKSKNRSSPLDLLINHKTFSQIQKKKPLKFSKTKSKIFTFGNKEHIKPVGKIDCHVEGNDNFTVETFYIWKTILKTFFQKPHVRCWVTLKYMERRTS